MANEAQEQHFSQAALPTLSKLGNPTIPTDLNVVKIASDWTASFATFAEEGDVEGVLSLFITSSFQSQFLDPSANTNEALSSSDVSVYWRDFLALTWDFRTFESTAKIQQFLSERLRDAKISNVQLRNDVAPDLQKPAPDLVWIQLFISFETSVGLCSGIVRLVPQVDSANGDATIWRAHHIFTNLENLKGINEKVGPLRSSEPNHGKWEEARRKEALFEGKDPTVIIIGGGQSGLDVAARLKVLDVPSLIIEQNARIGDNWRTRYEALCLHDSVWYNHMPYLPFPPTWPVYTPSKKLANWLEHYSEAMELNIWTSSTVASATQDPDTKIWSVSVKKSDGTIRVFKVKHIIMAIGFKGGKPYVPDIPGMATFKGEVLHSMQHNKAADHKGKKVVVIGSCTSAHDICVDYADNGIDVTMFQRSSTYVMTTKNGIPILLGGFYSENGPPTDLADRLSASLPLAVTAGIGYRLTKVIAAADKEILDGLHKRGFRTNTGYEDTGLLLLVYSKAGGYYMDVGGSQYIIDGKVKLKNDSQIKEFTETGLKFEDNSELSADVIVFCTGIADTRHTIRTIFGDDVAENSTQIWGLNEEGEIKGCWKEIGYKGLYNMMGNLALCRFYSKHLALQIKATEEGIFDGKRYSLAQ